MASLKGIGSLHDSILHEIFGYLLLGKRPAADQTSIERPGGGDGDSLSGASDIYNADSDFQTACEDVSQAEPADGRFPNCETHSTVSEGARPLVDSGPRLPTVTIKPLILKTPSNKNPIEYDYTMTQKPRFSVELLQVNRHFFELGSAVLYEANRFELQQYWPENFNLHPFFKEFVNLHPFSKEFGPQSWRIRNLSIHVPNFVRDHDPPYFMAEHFPNIIVCNFPKLDRLRLRLDVDMQWKSLKARVGTPWITERASLLLAVAFLTLRHATLKAATMCYSDSWRVTRCIADLTSLTVKRRIRDLPLLNCRRIRQLGMNGLYSESLDVNKDIIMSGDVTTSEISNMERDFLTTEDLEERYKFRRRPALEELFPPLKELFESRDKAVRLENEKMAFNNERF